MPSCVRTVSGLALACVLSAGLAVPSAQAAAAGCSSASARPAQLSERALVRATLCMLNAERTPRGLRPLTLNTRLSSAAHRHARDMAKRNYFSHTSLDGSSFLDRIRRAGYLRGARGWAAGENIAWGTGALATPRAIGRAWMQSPGHRANILSTSYREVGVGVAAGAPVRGLLSGATYATSFGARR
jgi:uncharacterized protein YkwD